MKQISMFENEISFPHSYDDIQSLYEKYIYEGEKDPDAFTWKDLKNSRSYFFYSKKVFEFSLSGKSPTLKVISRTDDKKFVTVSPSDHQLEDAIAWLKTLKKNIFRSLVTETFGCCDAFKECSAVDHCIHTDDRFYNGCMYRTNLEAGRNFYKEDIQ
ncbi:MAG: hypothetical protein IKD50_01755 [Clostridia bacterium]|nr:hypothetical protein [Clostridia bacterium]